MANASKTERLDRIKADILTQNICPDLAKTATQLVFGDGNSSADIVFIGEAPGKNEDQQGKPFIGAAGKFLSEMLTSIGLERKDVYITNIVKYRPPGNRDPLPEEKAAFLPYLWQQLLVIEPKLVITLGRHSMEAFLPGLKISQVHGQPKRIRVKGTSLQSDRPHLDAPQGSGERRTDDVGGKRDSRVQGVAKAHSRLDRPQGDGEQRTDSSAERPHVDALQGSGEKHTDTYYEYVSGASQPITQRSATKLGGVASLTGEQTELTWVILPLFHPAAALYNGSLRQTLLQDFAAIPAILAQLSH